MAVAAPVLKSRAPEMAGRNLNLQHASVAEEEVISGVCYLLVQLSQRSTEKQQKAQEPRRADLLRVAITCPQPATVAATNVQEGALGVPRVGMRGLRSSAHHWQPSFLSRRSRAPLQLL